MLGQVEEGPLPSRPAAQLAQGIMTFRNFAGEPSISPPCLSGVHRIEKKADIIQSHEESLTGITGVKGGLPSWPELGSGVTALSSNGNAGQLNESVCGRHLLSSWPECYRDGSCCHPGIYNGQLGDPGHKPGMLFLF